MFTCVNVSVAQNYHNIYNLKIKICAPNLETLYVINILKTIYIHTVKLYTYACIYVYAYLWKNIRSTTKYYVRYFQMVKLQVIFIHL